MRSYARLTREERHQIETSLSNGRSIRAMAAGMGRSPSTLSRELRRNDGAGGYAHARAQRRADGRLCRKPKCAKLRGALKALVEGLLAERWSPEQISGWLARQGLAGISHASICRHVRLGRANGGGLHRHLRQGGRRRKRYGAKEFRGRIPHRVDISERPPVVDSRERLGDWEADTVVGKGRQGALVTLVERKTRYALALPARRRTKDAVTRALKRMLKPLADSVTTCSG